MSNCVNFIPHFADTVRCNVMKNAEQHVVMEALACSRLQDSRREKRVGAGRY